MKNVAQSNLRTKPPIRQSETMKKTTNLQQIDIQDLQNNLFGQITQAFQDKSFQLMNDFIDDPSQVDNRDQQENLGFHADQLNAKETISRARNLIDKIQVENPEMMVSKPKPMKKKQQKANQGTFLTGAGLYEERKRISQPSKRLDDDDEPPIDMIEDQDIMHHFQQEEKAEFDDLEELRRMIQQTQNSIKDYAEEVYDLQGSVCKIHNKYQNSGYGANDDLVWKIQKDTKQYIPQGNKELIFDSPDYDYEVTVQMVQKGPNFQSSSQLPSHKLNDFGNTEIDRKLASASGSRIAKKSTFTTSGSNSINSSNPYNPPTHIQQSYSMSKNNSTQKIESISSQKGENLRSSFERMQFN